MSMLLKYIIKISLAIQRTRTMISNCSALINGNTECRMIQCRSFKYFLRTPIPDTEQINSMGGLWNKDNIKISYNQTFEIEGKKRRDTFPRNTFVIVKCFNKNKIPFTILYAVYFDSQTFSLLYAKKLWISTLSRIKDVV